MSNKSPGFWPSEGTWGRRGAVGGSALQEEDGAFRRGHFYLTNTHIWALTMSNTVPRALLILIHLYLELSER